MQKGALTVGKAKINTSTAKAHEKRKKAIKKVEVLLKYPYLFVFLRSKKRKFYILKMTELISRVLYACAQQSSIFALSYPKA